MLADILEDGLPWQDKSYCMTARYQGAIFSNTLERKQRTMVAVPVGAAQRGRYTQTGSRNKKAGGWNGTVYRNQKDNKSNCSDNGAERQPCGAPVRVGQYGKGGHGQRI